MYLCSSLLHVLCLLGALSFNKGLEFTHYRNSPDLHGYQAQASCGVLRCEEVTAPLATSKPENGHLEPGGSMFNIINSMTIYRKRSALSQPNELDKNKVPVAFIASKNESATAASLEDTRGTRVLDINGAKLLYDLATDEDCSSEFSCEVQGLDNKGQKLVSSTSLWPHSPHKITQGDGGSLESAVLLQLLSLVQQLDSKLAAMERRLGDKMEQRLDDRRGKSESLVDNGMKDCEQNHRVLDKLDQLDLKMSEFINATDRSEKEQEENRNDNLQIYIESLQADQKNAFEVLGRQVKDVQAGLVNVSISMSLVDDKVTQAIKCSQMNESLLESAVFNSTVEALSTLQPKRCEKGMANSLVQPPYPYYLISPNPASDLDVPYLCDTLTDGGGWVIVQRRTTGKIAFNRTWAEYKEGFGTLDDDFWLGNDNIHTLTSSGTWELKIDLKSGSKRVFAHYTRFSVAGEQDKYRLTVEGYSGGSTLPDQLDYHNAMQFTTVDNDNDKNAGDNCAKVNGGGGGWWYRSCDLANLNGRWNDATEDGIEWSRFTNDQNIIVFSEMKIRRNSRI